MPDDLLQLLPPAPPARGLLPERLAPVHGEEDPAPGVGRDHQPPGSSPSVFDEWMRHWVTGRQDAPRPAGDGVRGGQKGNHP